MGTRMYRAPVERESGQPDGAEKRRSCGHLSPIWWVGGHGGPNTLREIGAKAGDGSGAVARPGQLRQLPCGDCRELRGITGPAPAEDIAIVDPGGAARRAPASARSPGLPGPAGTTASTVRSRRTPGRPCAGTLRRSSPAPRWHRRPSPSAPKLTVTVGMPLRFSRAIPSISSSWKGTQAYVIRPSPSRTIRPAWFHASSACVGAGSRSSLPSSVASEIRSKMRRNSRNEITS